VTDSTGATNGATPNQPAVAAATDAPPTTTTSEAATPSPTPAPAAVALATAPRRRSALRGSLLLLVAFIVVGVAPLALAARVFQRSLLDRVPALGALLAPVGLAATTTPADGADLALPRAAWVAQMTAVRAGAASGSTVANLAPGFPVTLLAHAATDAGVWDQISWGGPTAAIGGTGWAPDAALTAVPGQGPIVGDAGALSPALAATLARVGVGTGLAVYYPAQHRLYLTGGDQLYPLGDGARALLATALLAAPVATPSPNALPLLDAMASRVAQNIPSYAVLAYQQIGGAAGLSGALVGMGVTGVQPGTTGWLATVGTPRALAHFYALLAGAAPVPPGATTLTPDVRARALAALAPDAATAAYAGLGQLLPAGASVTVVLGAGRDAGGWNANASEIVTTGDGLTYIAVLCARGLPSADSGTAAQRAVLAQLALIAQT
jgi:hypothetical protein